MNHRRIYMSGLVILLSLFLGLSNLGAKPVYATGDYGGGTIEVTKKDTSGNKLSGWTFKLYKKSSGIWYYLDSETTGYTGKVTWYNLSFDKEYKVCEVKQTGWTVQSPTASDGCQPSFILRSYSPTKTLVFVNEPPKKSIKVVKKDQNSNPLSNWEFKARNKSTNQIYGPVLTNSSGEATISGLPFGYYEVCETLKSGWAPVSGYSVCKDVTIDSSTPSGTSTSEGATTQTGDYGGGYSTYYFKNKPVRDVAVYKKDPSGNILGGWEFKLRKYGYSTILSTKTTTAGNPVTFTGLDVGTKYVICETKQSGWTVESPTDSNGCQTITPVSGTSAVVMTFVNKPPTRNIKVIKKDQNYNRLQNWQFTARNKSTNQTYGPVTTNSNGEAVFYDLPFGTYEVCETLQSGWVALNPSDGCSDITLSSSTTTSMVQTSDESATQTYGDSTSNTLYFYNMRQVRKIKVYKKNEYGYGLQNWQIKATNKSTNVVYGPVTTNSSGYAYIDNLPFGNYEVCEILQSGWTPVSGYSVCKDITIDSSTPTGSTQTSEGATTQTGDSGYLTVTFKNRPVEPDIKITKYTYGGNQTSDHGADADTLTDPNIPRITPGHAVVWNYVVENTGEVAFDVSKVTVTDDQPGVSVSFHSYLSGDTDTSLEPGEKWLYRATGTALDLKTYPSGVTIKDGCKTSDDIYRPVYENKGKVQITSGPSDTNLSHYCNPETPNIKITKYTYGGNKTSDYGADANDVDGDGVPRIEDGQPIVWNYVVENTGNVPFPKAKVIVTDDQPGVVVTYHSVISGDAGNGGDILDPGEKWLFKATGTAKNLTFNMGDGTTTVEGCKWSNEVYRPVYENKGKVQITSGPSATDLSHYCNPEDPKIKIIKYTYGGNQTSDYGADANSATGSDVPRIEDGQPVTWNYVVENTGNVPFPKDKVLVTDDQPGVTVAYHSVISGDSDEILEPTEKWLYKATGTAKVLTFDMADGTKTVEGCKTSDPTPLSRPVYENKGRVTIQITNGPTAYDYSHYCNPPEPGIKITKYTHGGNQTSGYGGDANLPNDGDVPRITAGHAIVWNYVVENTGNVPFPKAAVVVTDNRKDIPAANSVLPAYHSVISGDADEVLEPGEKWLYKATGTALDLTSGGAYTVDGCKNAQDIFRPTYENTGTVTVSAYSLTAQDDSHYCNPEGPAITIKKYTHGGDQTTNYGGDANQPNDGDVPRIPSGQPIVWNYVVENTGNVPFAMIDVVVTDSLKDIPVADSVVPQFHSVISGDAGNGGDILDPGEKWLFKATGTALDLTSGGAYTVDGCKTSLEVFRPTYENTGRVTVAVYSLTAQDDSHYCNPELPGIDIKKYTHGGNQTTGYGADADLPNGNDVPRITPGGAIVWTYVVTNTGNVPFPKANVVVTDNRKDVPVLDSVIPAYHSDLIGDNDAVFEPNEVWLFKATGSALNLPSGVAYTTDGCKTSLEVFRPTYTNIGTVSITGTVLTDSDPSHYCNLEDPRIEIKKYTHGGNQITGLGADADLPNGGDVPRITPGGDIEWSYVVSNTGNVPFPKANVVVTDDRKDIPVADSVLPSYVSELVGDGDALFEPGEQLLYKATGSALHLTANGAAYVVDGCQTGQGVNRPTYNNTGTVTITGTAYTDNDPSHYCNPEGPNIEIKKYTHGGNQISGLGADANDPNGDDVPEISPAGEIVWSYVVTNTGNVPFPKDSVVVTDDRGVTVNFDSILVGAGEDILEPGEVWLFKATGNALDLVSGGDTTVDGCKTSLEVFRPTYKNIGTVTVSAHELTDSDPSHYCNPELPGIEIKKYTHGGNQTTGLGADADNPNSGDVPRIDPNGAIVWSYVVSNTGNVPFPKANVVVTDNRKDIPALDSVNPAYDSELSGNGDETFDPGEIWLYKATGSALTLLGNGGNHIVDGCMVGENVFRPTYNNLGIVSVTGTLLTADDPSHYCNTPVPGIAIKKYTKGGTQTTGFGGDADDANGADVPKIEPDGSIEWTYVVSNTGNVPFAESDVEVTDNRGVIPVRTTDLVGDNDAILEPGEQWLYKATGSAEVLELGPEYVVEGCSVGETPKRPTYNNTGTVAVQDGPSDSDDSHYCNPFEPDIFIKKYTNGHDADSPTGPFITIGGEVLWTYVVTNPGNVALSNVVVTDNIQGVTPQYVSGDVNNDGKLDLTETWTYTAIGTATAGQYANIGYTKGTPPEGPDVTDDDPSHYFGTSPEVAALGDRVWHDLNANGVQDDGEPGVPGITVNLLAGDCETPMGQTDDTDGSGIYGFENLAPGSYCVQFDLEDLPSGFKISPQNVNDDTPEGDAADSDGDPATGKTQVVTLPGGTQNLTLDLGIYEPASLGDQVWFDLNANGIQDEELGEDFGVPNVTVNLLINNCSEVMDTTTTDGNGIYSFTNLEPGDYCVEFVSSSLPVNHLFSPQNEGDDALDSDADPETGRTQIVNLQSGEEDLTLDLGIFQLATLGNRVWVDTNKNGVQDGLEPDVPNVKVTLYNCNDQQVGDPDFTDGSGNYLFIDLMPGCYYVIFDPESLPEGYDFTTPNGNGINDTLDSDADGNGRTPSVTIVSGENYVDLDAGLVEPTKSTALAELGDFVWYDLNKNGLQDAGEPGVPNVKVDLYKAGGEFVATQHTAVNGFYLFTDLQPGSYYVEFATVPGYSYTRYNVNGNGQNALDSNPLVPWLDVTISTGGEEGELGKPLAYTFAYTNTDATLAATNVVISTTIPPGTSFVAASSDPSWNCPNTVAGTVCTLALANVPANSSGSLLFTVLLSSVRSDIPPGGLDIFASVTEGSLARTEVVTLGEGESNRTVDAGIVVVLSSLTTGTPSDPTNIPDGEQPKQHKFIFLPTLHHQD